MSDVTRNLTDLQLLELGWEPEQLQELADTRQLAHERGFQGVLVRWVQQLGRDGYGYGLVPTGDFPFWRGTLAEIREQLEQSR